MSRVSPCVVWADEDALPESCDLTAITPDTLAIAFVFASSALYNLTQRRWPGLCTDTFRPQCETGCWYWRCRYDRWDHGDDWYWHDSIRLPAIDVREITEVKIDGVAVAPSEYGLRNHRTLYAVRQPDGSYRSWPCYNDPHAPSTARDTWEITYTHGADPPPEMVTACALLAWEFAVQWTPDCEAACRLPQRVTTITRAGVTFAIVDPLSVFDKGMTGVPDIDLLIKAVERCESHQRAYVGRAGSPSQAFRQ